MYKDIFNEIVDIMHNDYAGYIDKKGWDNPKEFKNSIIELENKGALTNETFAEIVRDYLLDFQDSHMHFSLIKSEKQKSYDNGFQVRRYEDKLYITKLTEETRLKIGDAIISLDNIPIPELANKHQRELMETKAERQEWRSIISKYKVAEVMDMEGKTRHLELRKYEKGPYQPIHSIKRINEDTLCMTLTDFFDPKPINALLEKHKKELETTKNLIIDVRVNNGGTDLAYMNLGKYGFPPGTSKIDNSFYSMKFNITERNADLSIQSIEEELENINNEQYREGLIQWKEQIWEKNRGKGFVSIEGNSDFQIEGNEFPKNIIVLTDNYCGSSGDTFVYLCKQSPKVTVVGRPTMGMNDYSNLAEMKWNNQFRLMYPTSRLDQLDHRTPDHEHGIKPHIYIPWTPEHLEKDVDMEAALNLLREATPS